MPVWTQRLCILQIYLLNIDQNKAHQNYHWCLLRWFLLLFFFPIKALFYLTKTSNFVIICSKTKFWILFKFDTLLACFVCFFVCASIFAGKRSRQHILKFKNETLRKGRNRKNFNVYNSGCSCMWICFNISLFIISFIWCTAS